MKKVKGPAQAELGRATRQRIVGASDMRFVLASLLILCAVVAALQSTPKKSPPNRGQQDEQANDKNVPSVSAQTAPICAPSESNIQIKTTSPEQKASNWVDWFWPPEWANWALVIVGIWAARIAIGTLEQIREETKHSGELTKTALLHAQAVINTERPWMLVEYEWQKTEGLEGIGFYTINKGETPAEIVEAYFERDILPCIPDKLPIPPQYKSPILIPKRGDNLMVKGERWDLNAVPIHPESWIDNSMKRDAVSNALEFVYSYGVIIYRDMLHESSDNAGLHYTRFCFVYNVFLKTLFPTGPLEYRQKK